MAIYMKFVFAAIAIVAMVVANSEIQYDCLTDPSTGLPISIPKAYDDASSRTHIISVAPVRTTDTARRFKRNAATLQSSVTLLSSAPTIGALESLTSKLSPNDLVVFVADIETATPTFGLKKVGETLKELDATVVFAVDSVCQFDCAEHANWPANPVIRNGPNLANPKYFAGTAGALNTLFSDLKDNDLLMESNELGQMLRDTGSRPGMSVKLDYAQKMFKSLRGCKRSFTACNLKLDLPTADDEFSHLLVGESEPAFITADKNIGFWDHLSNYVPLPRAYAQDDSAKPTTHTLHIAYYVESISPFFELSLKSLAAFNYPKNLITLTFIRGDSPISDKKIALLDEWVVKHVSEYAAVEVKNKNDMTAATIEEMKLASGNKAEYFLMLDSLSRLVEPNVLQELMYLNRTVVAPLLSRPERIWSNFWSNLEDTIDVTGDSCQDQSKQCVEWAKQGMCGFHVAPTCPVSCGTCPTFEARDAQQVKYVSTWDYSNIVERKTLGVYAEPYVFGAVLFRGDILEQLATILESFEETEHLALWQLSFVISRVVTHRLHEINYLVNYMDMGHYINTDSSTEGKAATALNSDLFLLSSNPEDWQEMYMHENYKKFAEVGFIPNCSDVFRVPLFNRRFCKQLIEECENFGSWSGGTYNDERLQGGYEPVPTRDIHLNQLGLQDMWYDALTRFVRPVAAHHYVGYYLEGRSTLDFVVKYDLSGQVKLRPHHDASTVTINVALNEEFEGGGTHFIRQNCSVLDLEPGYAAMFPGRLTHQHEGLETTAGTRYILVSFIDQ